MAAMNFRERYQYDPATDKLGSGGFATVYRAHDTLLDREVALKIFHASENERVNLLNELKMMSRLDHPNLVRCLDILTVEKTNIHGQNESLHIGVMEYANRGHLKNFIQANSVPELSRQLLIQILQGLSYLHSRGIIHRDLKPQNILLTLNGAELTAKISDFGISKNLSSGTVSSAIMGTMDYMAPEQLSPAKYGINGRIATNLDLWSFGMVVYELVCGKPLLGNGSKDSSVEETMGSILHFTLPGEVEDLPEPFRTVVKRCLVPHAGERVKDPAELIRLLGEEKWAWTDEGFTKTFERVTGHDSQAEKTMVREKVATGEKMAIDETKEKKAPAPGIRHIPGSRQATASKDKGSRMPLYIAATLAVLVGLGALVQSMSVGPILAPYITGVMWAFSCLFSALYIHLYFTGKSLLKLSASDALSLKTLAKLAIGSTVLSPLVSGIAYGTARSSFEGIIWSAYEENFFLGAAILLSFFYMALGIFFILGMIRPNNIGYPTRKAVALSLMLLFVVPLMILLLVAKFGSLISIPLALIIG